MECCGRCQQVASDLADAIVASAVAAHPGDPEAIAADAMAAVDLILGPPPVVSTESPSMTPAELERRLASPGAKFSGHYHDPSGRYDYCDDPACPRSQTTKAR